MNAMLIIHPYKIQGVWVFDDEATGLVREPFVSSMGVIIDRMVKKVPNAERGFNCFFSAQPFPGHTLHLRWVRGDYGGNWYADEKGVEGWLCPALFKYFKTAPSNIYAAAEAQ